MVKSVALRNLFVKEIGASYNMPIAADRPGACLITPAAGNRHNFS
jgi:hypothetical protein